MTDRLLSALRGVAGALLAYACIIFLCGAAGFCFGVAARAFKYAFELLT